MKLNSRVDTNMTCKEIFKEINKRQITAIMFHSEMTIYFGFLGLQGFKRMHEYQHKSESCEHVKTELWFIEHHNELIPKEPVDSTIVIPADWYTVTRFDVSSATKKQATIKAMDEYREWEKDTKETLEEYFKILVADRHCIDCANFVNELIQDVSAELKKLERLMVELKNVDYDIVYINEIQKPLHDKYKKMLREV